MSEGQTSWGWIGTVLAACITVLGSIVVAVINHQPAPAPIDPTHGPARPPAVDAPSLTGRWGGSGVQMMPDGSQRAYNMVMDLVQERTTLTGVSRQDLLGTDYFAVVSLNGQVGKDGAVHLQDLVIQQSYPVQGQGGVVWWYAKTCSLELSADGNTLEGTWQAPGASGGTMRLQRR